MAPLRREGLVIVYREVSELRLDPCNPRKHSPKQIQQIAKSIQSFGFLTACLVDDQLQVVSGHGRVAAAKLLGISRVPTITVDRLSEQEIRAFQIADNRIAELSTWDKKLLGEQFQVLESLNLDFSLESTGFEFPEIKLLIESRDPFAVKARTVPEKFSEPEPNLVVTRTGDMWSLGPHRIVCGNPREARSYSALMYGQHAALVFTHLSSNDVADGASQHGLFSQLVEHSHPDALHFVVTDGSLVTTIAAAADRVGLAVADLCLAITGGSRPGSLYLKGGDFIVIFKKFHTNHSFTAQINRSNIWREKRTRSQHGRLNSSRASHGHLPVTLVAETMLESCAPADIVLDPNIGGGTTLLAAEQTDRICYAIGSDPRQVDWAVRDWQKLTGSKAVHAELGFSFDEAKEDRYVVSR